MGRPVHPGRPAPQPRKSHAPLSPTPVPARSQGGTRRRRRRPGNVRELLHPDAGRLAVRGEPAVRRRNGCPAPSESDPWRPAAHLTASQNWINDPNGLVYENGTYHAFYQHNPHGNFWGDMSWGHSTSTDLVHWTQQPVAMEGSASEEIFSGAIVPDTKNASGLGTAENPPLVALYTSSYGDGGALPKGSQAQSVAYSLDHGTSWTKYKGNPVLSLQPASNNFRDPKITWYEPGKYWVMTTVVADAQVVKLFKSTDLLHWNFLSDFSGVGAQGGLWEVPELLQMDVDGGNGLKKWVMILSINPGGIAGGSGMQYFVGDFDGTRFTAENAAKPGDPLTDSQWLDHGADFYAANTITAAPGGKPVLARLDGELGLCAVRPEHPVARIHGHPPPTHPRSHGKPFRAPFDHRPGCRGCAHEHQDQ